MCGHFDNKRAWKDEGVSEVIGTLLILAITVVLFSGVIYMVGNIPTPESSVSTSLQGSIEPVSGDPDDWTAGAYVNITNRGGIVLKGSWTSIILILNDSSSSHRTLPGLNGDGDEDWETGETWNHTIPAGTLTNTTGVSVMIIAEDRSAIVWVSDLRPSVDDNNPPVIMSVTVTSVMADLNANFIQYNEDFTIRAKVVDFDHDLNATTVWADMTSIGIAPLQLIDPDLDGVFTGVARGPVDRYLYALGNHPVIVNASDLNSPVPGYASKVSYIPLGGDFSGMSNVAIAQWEDKDDSNDNITFGYGTLVHNKPAEITATVWNWGEAGAMITVEFYDGVPGGNISLATLIDSEAYVQIPPNGGSTDVTIFNWIPNFGGEHTIFVKLIPDPNVPDSDITNHEANRTVTVQPTILVVDDDGHANDKTELDTSSFMRAALSAGNFVYDFTSVAVGDGPGYDTGDYKMVNYDVVIWMTGYTTGSTLTPSDVSNLKKYLTVGQNAGSLWLIGQGVLGEAAAGSPVRELVTDYLHIENNGWTLRNPMSSNLTGSSWSDPVTGYLANGTVNVVQRGGAGVYGYTINDDAAPTSAESLVNWDGTECYGVRYAQDLNNSRTYFTPWEFSRIEDVADQAQLAYQVIRWLGNINSSFGRDLAVSEQTIDRDVVYFKQPVLISGVVRNNGFQNETAVVRLTVFFNGYPLDIGIPDLVAPVSNEIGNNSIVVGPFVWVPEYVGSHSIVLEVDPDGIIDETNEDNNVVSNYLASGTINVQYSVLVVDDDESANNGGGLSNETAVVRDTLTELGYYNESVVVGASLPGPDDDTLKNYNAVVWSTGDAMDAIQLADVENLTTYLNGGGRLWFLGRGGLSTGASVFQQNFLGVANVSIAANPATLLGVYGNNISHGVAYAMDGGICQLLTPTFTASGAFRLGAGYNGVMLSQGGFRSVTTAFSLSDLNGSAEFPGDRHARVELAYMVMHWFDLPDERVEFRATLSDFTLLPAGVRPQLGDSYVLQTQVRNVGGSAGNALVRFMDGTTQIGSDSITVSADGYTTAEVIWTPLFAGVRTLRVYADPINETGEVIDWFNNQLSYTTYVYFFYDDMEGDATKWQHDSTVTLINGEQPLDYIGNTVISMNIEKSWDWTMTADLENCTDTGFYHTFNKSYWMQEPVGSLSTPIRPPIDVVFALDTSGSMTATARTNLRTATKEFIGKLAAGDRAAIYTYDGGGDEDDTGNYDASDAEPLQRRAYSFMTAANKTIFNTTIDAFTFGGYTPFYDTVGDAIEYTQNNILPGRLEYVIGMTDGVSNSDDEWTPQTSWGLTTTSDPQDYDDDNWRQNSGGLKGILNPPCMVYSIGLGIQHDPAYPTAPSWSRTAPVHDDIGTDNYEIEYDVWHIADASPGVLHDAGGKYGQNYTTGDDNVGHYYYTTDATQLPSIFDAIFTSIGTTALEGENITRASDGQPTRAYDGSGIHAAPPAPAPKAVSSYNYVGITAASGPHDAYYKAAGGGTVTTTNWDMTGAGGWTEFADGNYDQIEADDALYREDDNANAKYYRYEYIINEVSTDVSRIDTRIIVNTESTAQQYFYIWNYATGQWTQLAASTASGEHTMTAAITVGAPNYVSATSRVALAFYQADPVGTARWVRTDFTNLTITYTPSSRTTIIGVVPASPCGNAAPTITYQISPAPATPPTSVDMYYSTTGGASWTFWATDLTADGSWTAIADPLPSDGTYHFSAKGVSAYPETTPSAPADSEWGPWTLDRDSPDVISSQPTHNTVDVPLQLTVEVRFDEMMKNSVIPTLVDDRNTTYTFVSWQFGTTTAVYTHPEWNTSSWYNLTLSGAQDLAGNFMTAPYTWTFRTAAAAAAFATGTIQAVGTANNTPIVTYSWQGYPSSVWIYYTMDNGATWTHWATDMTIDGIWYSGASPLPLDGTYGFYAVATGGGATEAPPADGAGILPEASPYVIDRTGPGVYGTTPGNGLANVARSVLVKVRFNERMRTSVVPTISGGAVAYTFSGWSTTAVIDDTATWTHADWQASTLITMTVSNARDYAGNIMAAPYPWSFTTGTETGTGGGTPGLSPPGDNSNKTAVTKAMNLTNLESATLSFWHKYNIVPGANGGVLLVGFKDSAAGAYKWRYVVPSSAYTGNLRLNLTAAEKTGRTDDMGTYMQWGWNGVSGRGTFAWEKVSVDLIPWVNATSVVDPAYDPLSSVRVKFQYYQYGGGTGYGWYLDDVKVSVSRDDADAVDQSSADVWQTVTTADRNGANTTAWWNGDVTTGFMKKGVDNSLICGPIDLTNARNATLGAYFKFNINTKDGAPPDGFRVEVSRDNGITWSAINLGVRAAWNVSGVEPDNNDGKVDGKSYTGIDSGNYWVSAGSLTRLNVDLSSFTGSAIMLRFRAVTNSNPLYLAYKSPTVGFGGFFIDDVTVTGNTILG